MRLKNRVRTSRLVANLTDQVDGDFNGAILPANLLGKLVAALLNAPIHVWRKRCSVSDAFDYRLGIRIMGRFRFGTRTGIVGCGTRGVKRASSGGSARQQSPVADCEGR